MKSFLISDILPEDSTITCNIKKMAVHLILRCHSVSSREDRED